MVFSSDMRVMEMLRFSKSVAARHWKWSDHWNGYRLSLTRALRADEQVESLSLDF